MRVAIRSTRVEPGLLEKHELCHYTTDGGPLLSAVPRAGADPRHRQAHRPSFLTVLLQDEIGGLQVLHQGRWVDVSPIPGALVVNIGDLLQLVSNDKFKSIEHRVLASAKGPRISVAVFFNPSFDEKKPYGPVKELLSETNPPAYRDVTVAEYIMNYLTKGLTSSSLDAFKL
ncbi:1-aminocyclopropane-1-carboxylate oxidase [Ananas comosus]|uniref:1-aminocyclopropane-1-carboxylate oxidase n=1 Tax=Ananas comosus TaxID=4615 RepID=A0A199W1C8_ANACO|nr:1-aminocyclopropane-1-carboxylate oxidase [Ananas comosus]